MCRRVYNYTADAYGELASSVRLFFQNLNVAHFSDVPLSPPGTGYCWAKFHEEFLRGVVPALRDLRELPSIEHRNPVDAHPPHFSPTDV